MEARAITKALGGKWAGRYGLARCPVHGDKTPSLKVRDDARKSNGIDVHCFAGCDWKDIKAALQRQGLIADFKNETPRWPRAAEVKSSPKIETTDEQRSESALSVWESCKPLAGTLGWRYFTEHRGLQMREIDHVLRYHNIYRMVAALMTDPATGEPRGIHRTFLNADGSKRERKMLGRQGVVRLSPDEEVTQGLGIAEGIEDVLGILAAGWSPVWAATSCGAIERFPVLSGIEYLTIFADNDEAGAKAARMCAERWIAAGQEVRISTLRNG